MASTSYPSPAHADGAVTEMEYERLVSSTAADGVIGAATDPPMAFADGTGGVRAVKVRANTRALVRGFLYDSGASDTPVLLPANGSGSSRTDLIVLRLNRDTWAVTEDYVQGTPGQPAPNPVRDPGPSGLWDLPLAQVVVANGATSIAAGNVTPVAWWINPDGQIVCNSTARPYSPPVGTTVYETDKDLYRRWNGSGWLLNPMPAYAWRTADLARVSNALVADPQLSLPVAANAVYELELSAGWSAHVSGNFRWDWSVPASTTLSRYRHLSNDGTNTAIMATTLDATTIQARTGGGIAVVYGLAITGLLKTAGTAGNCAWRWGQNTTSTDGTTVFADAFLKLTRIG